MKGISLLGATGSIGTQTIQIIEQYPEQFVLVAMSFGRNLDAARTILQTHTPALVCVSEKEDADKLQSEFSGSNITFLHGEQGLIEVATAQNADVVVTAVMGSVGLLPTLAAIRAKKTIALANKETLVTAGHIVMEEARKHNVAILPVDSEHSAIFQCLNGENRATIHKINLTASGGSFRDKTREELKDVTVEQALAHPNWSMGAKITIDSATMMNKGLEVIEAKWLFDVDYDQIDVTLHKQSVIHSMVEFCDSSVIAQLGNPDMRVPILYALTYPERYAYDQTPSLSLSQWGTLTFQEMDVDRFRMLAFAYEAGVMGGSAPTVLNAANEIAVDAFLKSRISFLEIEDVVEQMLNEQQCIAHPSLQEILHIDEITRTKAMNFIEKRWS
ncbi:MAG: 1-deoxy-D-xylulose-5-phosphate reductoisomerase [Bacilli bacterium]